LITFVQRMWFVTRRNQHLPYLGIESIILIFFTDHKLNVYDRLSYRRNLFHRQGFAEIGSQIATNLLHNVTSDAITH